MTCPHQGSYKISPFPMKHQQTFWRVWLSPRWISLPTPTPRLIPPWFPPLPLSSANTTPLWANLRSSTSPVTGSGHRNTERDEGRATKVGETCTKPFSWSSQRRWWEEDALRAAGGAWHGFHRSVLLLLPPLCASYFLWRCSQELSGFSFLSILFWSYFIHFWPSMFIFVIFLDAPGVFDFLRQNC